MKRSAMIVSLFLVCVAVSRPVQAITVFEDKANDRSLSVGVLLQTQATFTAKGAPNGDLSTDFFLRRVRMYAAGQIAKGLTFFLQIDQPNLDKGGDFSGPPFFRDAVMSYEVVRELSIDAGLILEPFTHNSLEGAGSLHTIDYRNGGLLYPATEGRLFSDTGVQLRGLVIGDRLHYRVVAFEGARGPAEAGVMPGATGVVPVNEKGIPRFMGMLRLNLLGVEDKFFFQGVYFTDHPLLSIGVGADYQPHALRVGAAPNQSPNVFNYSAFNADVFLEYPLPGDMEIIANAAVVKWNQGTGSIQTGTSVFGEAGFRIGIIEPIIAGDYFKAENNVRTFWDIRPELNLWFRKNNANVKAEFAYVKDERPSGGAATISKIGTIQGQVYF